MRQQFGSLVGEDRNGPWFIWDSAGVLAEGNPKASGVFRDGTFLRPLGDDERADAAALQKNSDPVEIPSETVDPLKLFDEKGDPRPR